MNFECLKNELISLYIELEGCTKEEALKYINTNFTTESQLLEEIEWVCEMLCK